nr:unnamed protein product [Callosobruchus chinensis]
MMLGRTPREIEAIRPLKDGAIADFKSAEEMLKYFIRSANTKFTLNKPNIIICVPSGSTPAGRRAIQDAAESAGANGVFLIEEPMAAAIGAGLPVTDTLINLQGFSEWHAKRNALSEYQVAESLLETVHQITSAIRTALESTPPELSSDIVDRGIILSGGGGLLRNLGKVISETTKLPVGVADDPLCCVALGSKKVLENMDYFGHVLFKQD